MLLMNLTLAPHCNQKTPTETVNDDFLSLLKEGKSINIFKLSRCETLILQIIWKRTLLVSPTSIDLQSQKNFISIWALVITPGLIYMTLSFCMAERHFNVNLILAQVLFFASVLVLDKTCTHTTQKVMFPIMQIGTNYLPYSKVL